MISNHFRTLDRCPSCRCSVPARHVADSEECRTFAEMRLTSQRADG